MHERAQKLERGYNYLFTDVIDLAAPDWFTRVHQSIADQQNGLVWVSEKVAAPEEDDENLDQGEITFHLSTFYPNFRSRRSSELRFCTQLRVFRDHHRL